MSLYSIASHSIFLRILAENVINGRLLGGADRSQPFWLTDVTIIVPTRRAKLALANEFLGLGQNLLPDIRTFGGEAEDEEPFLPPFDAPTPVPAASALERRLVLSKLVDRWANTDAGRQAFSTPPTAGEILSMADSLGTLIDDLIIEERSAGDIRAIVPEIEANLGAYWQQTLTFLDIALQYWPQYLAGTGKADAAGLRGERLDRQAGAASLVYGDRPVIAAGSTGSIPATARLLQAINELPRGAVVLPGLDCTMSAADHAALLDDGNNPHGHPQYVLAKLLRQLGAGVGEVMELVEELPEIGASLPPPLIPPLKGEGVDWRGDVSKAPTERTLLVSRALALTKDTAEWAAMRLAPEVLARASEGLAVIRARNEDEEARAVALAARARLADKQTVGIVTPDRNLARRIAAELKRFEIYVDDAAGVPLFQSAAGRLLRQILALASGGCAPVDLMALLRNRAALFGQARGAIAAVADGVELGLLRGQRPNAGVAGLRALLAANLDRTTKYPARKLKPHEGEAIGAWLTQLETALAPLLKVLAAGTISGGEFAEGLCAAFTAVAEGADIAGRQELDDWARQMATHGGEGHRFAPRQLEGVLSALMLGFQVRTHEERRSDIAIWGQLEARLQHPDLVILAGLNEDKWPETADPGPWLSRGMRLAAGLEPPERRQGQAAHDFAQALGNGEVIVSFSDRVGSSPATPSRLVQRLEAFAGAAAAKAWQAEGACWLDDARRLDAVSAVVAAQRPMPNPAASIRPRQLSITEIETLMRSPYDLYARHVLRLQPLDPLGDAPDARERGNIIHDIFGDFVSHGHDVMAENALEVLKALAVEKFAGLDQIAERRDIWLRRFTTAAEQFLVHERAREPQVKQRHAEIRGEWTLQLAEKFVLTGRADRVDEMVDGTLEIIDFKTGTPPTPAAMKAFEVPQLLLEAQMGQAGALAGIGSAETSRLTYIKIGLGPEAFSPKDFTAADDYTLMEAADELGRRMQGHIAHFLFDEVPMPARLLPLQGQRFAGAYEHLARVAEWTAVDGEDGGEA